MFQSHLQPTYENLLVIAILLVAFGAATYKSAEEYFERVKLP